ncbi:hypothetical protein Tco_0410544 [Tanacetum coccineum]
MQAARDEAKSYANLKHEAYGEVCWNPFKVNKKGWRPLHTSSSFLKEAEQKSPNTYSRVQLKEVAHADDPISAIPLDGLHFDDKLPSYYDGNLRRSREVVEVKRLKLSRIPLVPFQWNSQERS